MIVTVEGVMFEVTNELPKEGEMYIGHYSGGNPHLYTAKTVDLDTKWMVPDSGGQPHEFSECKSIIRIIDDLS